MICFMVWVALYEICNVSWNSLGYDYMRRARALYSGNEQACDKRPSNQHSRIMALDLFQESHRSMEIKWQTQSATTADSLIYTLGVGVLLEMPIGRRPWLSRKLRISASSEKKETR